MDPTKIVMKGIDTFLPAPKAPLKFGHGEMDAEIKRKKIHVFVLHKGEHVQSWRHVFASTQTIGHVKSTFAEAFQLDPQKMKLSDEEGFEFSVEAERLPLWTFSTGGKLSLIIDSSMGGTAMQRIVERIGNYAHKNQKSKL